MPALIPIFRSTKAPVALRFALVALPTLAIAMAAFRTGHLSMTELTACFAVASGMALVAVATALWALSDLWRRGGAGAGQAALALLVALVVLTPAIVAVTLGTIYPPINDVTTRADDPPAFEAVAAERQAAGASLDYPGEAASAAQAAAWPDLHALEIAVPPDIVFEAARGLVEAEGWQVHAMAAPAEGAAGRIEATARTLLLGFPDDIVIAVTPTGAGSRVDIRSASRYGQHDLGQNGRRAAAFIRDLTLAIDAIPPAAAAPLS